MRNLIQDVFTFGSSQLLKVVKDKSTIVKGKLEILNELSKSENMFNVPINMRYY